MSVKNPIIGFLFAVLLTVPLFSFGQSPLIIVNGRITDLTDLKAIKPEDIERIDTEPVDEQSVAIYGTRANNGIIHVTLKFDEPARFTLGDSFDDYVESQIKWNNDEAAARVSVRYTIAEDGRIEIGEVLESTEGRLKRRVLAAIAPFTKTAAWSPARKNGTPVATERVLQVQLPKGKRIRRDPYIILL